MLVICGARIPDITIEIIFNFGYFRLDCLSIFNLSMHLSNVIFSKETENNNFFQKKLFKKLFNFEVIFFLFNTDETQTLFFRMF